MRAHKDGRELPQNNMGICAYSLFDVEAAFKVFLDTHGHSIEKSLRFDTIEFNRSSCPHASNRSNQDMRYKIFSDGVPSGYFKCWHCGIDADFCFKQQHEVSLEAWKKHTERLSARKQQDEEYLKKLQESACKTARQMWDSASLCNSHAYLEIKNVQSYGLRVHTDGTLLVPCYNGNFELVNIERIYFDKQAKQFQKRPLKGGQRIGAFFVIGEMEGVQETIYICEGYSTAATVYSATGYLSVVSFNCGNLSHVSQEIRRLYPKSNIIIAADRDLSGAGEIYARKAASLVGGHVCLPNFSSLNLTAVEIQQKKISDFNDLYTEFLGKGFSKEAALGEVQLQLNNKDVAMLADKNELSSENNIASLNTTIKKTDYPELIHTKNGKKPLNTYGNLKYMLDRLGITVRWNDMSRVREVKIPNFPVFYDDEENSALNEIINLATMNHMPTARIDEHLNSLAQQNHYHPIVECVKSRNRDGVERLDKFIKTLKTTNDTLACKLIRRWMLSAIAAAFSEKGFAAQGALVLQGKQGIGKTRWVKSLDPSNCNAIKEAALLDPSNKDSIITLSRYWIVELGELDGTFRKIDIARIKSYITNQCDEIRVPHAKKNSRYARRTVYVATVNESRYLVDDSGNRRWWTVEVVSIDLEHGLDMQQVWAEAHSAWIKGEQTWLTDEELSLLNASNTEHEQIDPLEEKILDCFDWVVGWEKFNTVNMTSSEVLKNIGYSNPNKAQATRVGTILVNLTGKKPQRRKHVLPRLKPCC